MNDITFGLVVMGLAVLGLPILFFILLKIIDRFEKAGEAKEKAKAAEKALQNEKEVERIIKEAKEYAQGLTDDELRDIATGLRPIEPKS